VSHSVWASVRVSVEDSGDAVAGYCFKTHVADNVLLRGLGRVRSIVSESVVKAVFENVREPVWDNIADCVSIWDSIDAAVADGLWERGTHINRWNSFDAHVDGQHESALLAAYHFFHGVMGLTVETKELSGLWELARSGGRMVPHQNICWICDRREVLECDED